ncbi:helix-turn-helix domain-containing protein [Persephonella sp.]
MDRVQIAKEIITKTIGEKSVYSVEDAQRLLNKSRQEIYNLIYEGILKPIERNNKHNKPRRYTFTFISLLDAYIKLTEGE